MALNCVVAAALARPLGHVGLALATSVSATANALALAILLRRRLPGAAIPGARRAWLRTAAVSAGLAAALSAMWRLVAPGRGRLGEAAWLATVIVGAAVAYVGCHAALGAEEVRLASTGFARRWRRSSLRRRETR